MEEIGGWMKVNGEAIFATRPIAPYKDGNVSFTRKGKTVYAICVARNERDLPPSQISFSGLRPAAGSEVRILGVAEPVRWHADAAGKIAVDIPVAVQEHPPCRHAWVVTFERAEALRDK